MRKQFSLIAFILTVFVLYAYGQEIENKRTKNSVTYQIDKQKYQTIISTEPMNYFDSSASRYKKVNKTVRDTTDVDGNKFVDTGYYKAIWKANKPFNYAFKAKGKLAKFRAQFDSTNLTVKHEVLAEGVKQTITLINSSAPTTLSWKIVTDALMEQVGSIINFKSGSETLFSVSTPVAWDNNKLPVPVSVTLNGDLMSYSIIPTGFEYPITVDPTVTSTMQGQSGRTYNSGAIYLTVQAATSSESSNSTLYVGQYYNGLTNYFVIRSLMNFPIGNFYSVTACTLFVNGEYDGSVTADFNVNIYGARSYKSILTTADYSLFNGWRLNNTFIGTLLTNTWSSASYSDNWNALVFDAAGLDSVIAAKNDTLWIAMVSSLDAARTAPTGEEYISWENGANAPYLSYTYTSVPVAPSNFANTGATTTTLSYSWTDNSSNESGFKIKNAGGDTATVGTYAAEATTGVVSNLNQNTRYGLRVFAYNSSGWSTPSDSVVTYTLMQKINGISTPGKVNGITKINIKTVNGK